MRYNILIMMSSCLCTLHLCLFVLSRRLEGEFPSGAVSRRWCRPGVQQGNSPLVPGYDTV